MINELMEVEVDPSCPECSATMLFSEGGRCGTEGDMWWCPECDHTQGI